MPNDSIWSQMGQGHLTYSMFLPYSCFLCRWPSNEYATMLPNSRWQNWGFIHFLASCDAWKIKRLCVTTAQKFYRVNSQGEALILSAMFSKNANKNTVNVIWACPLKMQKRMIFVSWKHNTNFKSSLALNEYRWITTLLYCCRDPVGH